MDESGAAAAASVWPSFTAIPHDSDESQDEESSFQQTGLGTTLKMRATWDPTNSTDWDSQKPTSQCVLRIQRDIQRVFSDPPPGILIAPCEDDVTKMDALIVGPADTPYENGFFHFFVRMPPNYPLVAPRVRIMNTDNGQVRFNPNVYANGKVCLSILGTWSGPGWSAAQNITSVMLSIQSLLCSKPYFNEPGFETEHHRGHSDEYNKCIHHETLRVAVCGILEKRSELPVLLRKSIVTQFDALYDSYSAAAEERRHLDGKPLMDPHSGNKGIFRYGEIIKRLEALRPVIAAEAAEDDDGSVSGESDLSDYDPDKDDDSLAASEEMHAAKRKDV